MNYRPMLIYIQSLISEKKHEIFCDGDVWVVGSMEDNFYQCDGEKKIL